MEENKKQERTVIHLYVKANDTHYYFGSVANIYEHFAKEQIGITFGSLRNYGLSASKPYENKLVIIRKGILLAKPKQKKREIVHTHNALDFSNLYENTSDFVRCYL
jgi:hypothetical protein